MSDTTISQMASGYEFRIATVFRRTFAVYKRGFVLFMLSGAACTAELWLIGPTQRLWQRHTAQWGIGSFWSGFLGSLLVSFFVSLGLKMAVAFAVFWTRDILAGNRPGVVSSFRSGAPSVAIVLIGGILTSAATLVGLILMVLPGLILSCVFAAVAAAASFERLGILASIRRGSWLARGNLGRLFAILLLPYVAYFALIQIVTFLAIRLSSIGILTYFNVAAATVYHSVIIALACVVYFELRAAKEGAAMSSMVGVFD